MAAKSKVDTYANVAAISVTEAVAGTTAYAKFAFPFSIMDKMALVIQRIEYQFGALQQLNGTTDKVVVALTAASGVVDLDNQADPLIIDSARITRLDLGAAASGILLQLPYVKDYTNLAGGGLLVAPSPLYAAIQSTGAAAVMAAWVRMYYTYMELNSDEYWQLVESRRIISG